MLLCCQRWFEIQIFQYSKNSSARWVPQRWNKRTRSRGKEGAEALLTIQLNGRPRYPVCFVPSDAAVRTFALPYYCPSSVKAHGGGDSERDSKNLAINKKKSDGCRKSAPYTSLCVFLAWNFQSRCQRPRDEKIPGERGYTDRGRKRGCGTGNMILSLTGSSGSLMSLLDLNTDSDSSGVSQKARNFIPTEDGL